MSAARIETDLTVQRIEKRTKTHGEDAAGWVELITELIQSVADGSDISKVILCVNAVEINGQTLTSSVVPGISDVIGKLVTKRLPIEVQCDNWPIMLATYRQLDDPVPDPMLLLHVADGVSAHCIVDGTLFRGGSGLAGELGHVVVNQDGPPCGCGRNGCLEACCSGPAIRERLLASLEKGAVSAIDPESLRTLTPVEVVEVIWQHWNAGDEFVRRFMDQILDQLAWALGLAINLIDPQAVVVAGYVLLQRPQWLEEVERRVQRWVIHAGQRKIRFIESRATLSDVLQTAALQHFYRDNRTLRVRAPQKIPGIKVNAEDYVQRLLEDAIAS